MTTNGKEAYFLVGGEFPVPVLQGGANAGAVTVQFREFGIKLIFTAGDHREQAPLRCICGRKFRRSISPTA